MRTRFRLASSTLMRADLQPPPPKREQPDGGGDGVGVEHRLGAVGGVFLDGEVGEHKARPRKQPQLHRGEAHGPAQGGRDKLGDPALVAADADQRRHDEHGENDRERRQGQPKPLSSAPRALRLFRHGLLW